MTVDKCMAKATAAIDEAIAAAMDQGIKLIYDRARRKKKSPAFANGMDNCLRTIKSIN